MPKELMRQGKIDKTVGKKRELMFLFFIEYRMMEKGRVHQERWLVVELPASHALVGTVQAQG